MQEGNAYKNVVKQLHFARYGTLNCENPQHTEWLSALILRILGSAGNQEANCDDVAAKTVVVCYSTTLPRSPTVSHIQVLQNDICVPKSVR